MTDSATTLLDTLARRAERLCSLPAVAVQVLELTSNPQVDTWALKECIENDPALTTRILRVVNSSLFGLSREVSDLNQALALLGTKPLKLLVLGFSLPAGLFAGVSGAMAGRYWRRTLTKAVAARELAQLLWKAPGDEAFTAGLLQDLGMLVLIQEVGPAYVRLMEKALAVRAGLAEAERQSLGFDHVTLSARLLARWGLPESLVEAVGWNPQKWPEQPPTEGFFVPHVVYQAELVAQLVVDGNPAALDRLLDAALPHLDFHQRHLDVLIGKLEEKVGQLAEVLSLELPPGTGFLHDVLLRSQAQLAEVAASTATDLVRFGLTRESSLEADLGAEIGLLAEAVQMTGMRTRRAPAVAAPTIALQSAAVAAPPRRAPAAGWLSDDDDAQDLDDPRLLRRLEVAVAACRQARCPLSLLLVEVNHLEKLAKSAGASGIGRVRRTVEHFCRELDHPAKLCVGYGKAGFALILPNCDRREVVELGNALIDRVRAFDPGRTGTAPPFTASVGSATVALPPKNFPAPDLMEAASRCLYGSRIAGGSVMKSIEI